jgi:hypothetical protein
MGIHGPMPKVFWYTVPGIKLFRQYYHLLPLFTLNAILLTTICLFHFLKAKTPKKLTLGILLLATAIVPGAFQTKWATEQVEARLLPRAIEPPSPSDGEQFLTRALFDFPLGSPLAMPKDATLPTFDVLSKRFIPWWEMKNGSRITAVPQSILLDGFRMTSRSIPVGASAIKFLQYDDGNWAGPLNNSPDKLLTISAENLRDGISLQRNPTFWPYLLFLMLSAVAVAIVLTVGKRKKAGSSAPSPISNQKFATITDVAG